MKSPNEIQGVQPTKQTLMQSQMQLIKIAILAMGGEGGGVLADWIVNLAEAHGYFAQTTSVPGVAQRTGATVYYVELFPGADNPETAVPVLALMPTAGDVDIVLASELMEAGRAVQRGLVTPDRTTLITSTHRVFSMKEKSAMGDGRVDSNVLIQQCRQAARHFVHFDMASVAEKSGSVISAVLFGALCGIGILPFNRTQFEETIIKGGVGIKPSLTAFGLGLGRVQSEDGIAASTSAFHTPNTDGDIQENTPDPHHGHSDRGLSHDGPTDQHEVKSLLQHIQQQMPPYLHDIAQKGIRRLIDYQDPAYARLYLERLQALIGRAGKPDHNHSRSKKLLCETARHLALWMAYEDTIRVADLKIRASRFERISRDVAAGSDQLIEIKEFLHPRIEEICDTLPVSVARWLSDSHFVKRILEKWLSRGHVITTSSIGGYLLLYTLASWRRMRRHTLRFQQETERIEKWLQRIGTTAAHEPALALEIVHCQRLIKGYGDTYTRGMNNFQTLMQIIDRHLPHLSPTSLRLLREAALADEHGDQLRACQRHLSLY
ncbi:indolepyruvate oxidoreductase subunit B [Xenorhabdus mauleonii]|uniref:Indolepyruvate ferredoxin oxidoreductase beta subunit n=1 Tax=Xenorhabdus mauleonii TaxID=351675 RepID=A0A1I3KET2_9GAMM|nr:indolepyruvate oxidoreductase subunit beta family protein [Xenorhabdus mauleonii]PHM45029.1 indolepyruvate oxidoreductase subunit B [Xenorhabdus mauleonii]SFI71006.1 indolepyruvate ferredoxin oxidoreductase beta subunit [Xenorhabdus mauleonii]